MLATCTYCSQLGQKNFCESCSTKIGDKVVANFNLGMLKYRKYDYPRLQNCKFPCLLAGVTRSTYTLRSFSCFQ